MDAPVFKIPFFHIIVALIINIIQCVVLNHKIGRKVIDIRVCRVEPAAHILDLAEISQLHRIAKNQIVV